MKTYQVSDLEKVFSFNSLAEVSLEKVSEACDAWENKLEDAYQRGWITMEAYARSLLKINGMANYLMYLVRNHHAYKAL